MAFLDEVGLAELWSLIQAEDEKRPIIATGSYVGAGVSGVDYANTLTFAFEPQFVVIPSSNSFSPGGLLLVRGQATASILYTGYSAVNPKSISVSWNGNSVSWYNATATNGSTQPSETAPQLNIGGTTYHYVAFG